MYSGLLRRAALLTGCAALLLLLAACAPKAPAATAPAAAEMRSGRVTSPLAAEPVVFSAHTPGQTPPPAPPAPFSIAWISDTQTLVCQPRYDEVLPPMFQWIADTREQYNTICAVHTGDIVENGFNPEYWEKISPLIDEMEQTVPFVPAAGNHDIGRNRADYTPYLTQPFVLREDPAQQFDGGKGYYQTFETGGEKVIVAGLGYDLLDESAMAWLRQTFDAYPDHTGVLALHSYLSVGSRFSSVLMKEGARVRDAVVAKCPNVRLVLCGHVKGAFTVAEQFDDDGDGTPERTVHALRYNYQNQTKRRSGFLRMLTFDPAARSIAVYTYSPYLESDCFDPAHPELEHFTIEQAF